MNPVFSPFCLLPFALPFESTQPVRLLPVARRFDDLWSGTDCGRPLAVCVPSKASGSERRTR